MPEGLLTSGHTSQLFSAFTLRGVTLRNRIVVSPMCQYQAVDGVVNDWHFAHYASLARGGSSLVVVEATGVSPEGRITTGCAGLWNDVQADALSRVATLIKAGGAVPGIQLGHAGRKASILRPWESTGDTQIPEGDPAGWMPIAPSAIAFGGKMPRPPREMSLADIKSVQDSFVTSARRAFEAGFEWLELHFAHGFLAQTFFSTTANQRTDAYGGSYDARKRFLIETLAAVRHVWPERLPLSVKFGVVEFDGRDEDRLNEVVSLFREFKASGADLLDASMGFTEANDKIPWSPGMLVPIAAHVRREVGIPIGVSWGVESPRMAEAIIAEQRADLVYIAKAMLANPHYPYQMARVLGVPRPSEVLPITYGHWLGRYSAPE
jgi:2,4-dienoyl-CoA reductase-like NADH-dependent reductase (Old Yellow Enzyme family)